LPELPHLRIHPIRCRKISSGIGDKRSIGRMIDGFHRRNGIHDPGIMAVNVLHELDLAHNDSLSNQLIELVPFTILK
jgi:hypothetical protein